MNTTSAILMDSLNSLVVNGSANKATIADLIEINTNAPSSGISSMNSSNTNSAGSSPSTSPKATIFPNLNQSQESLKRQNSKLQELILPLSPGLSVSSASSSPLQQLSLSSKSDDVFYKYL